MSGRKIHLELLSGFEKEQQSCRRLIMAIVLLFAPCVWYILSPHLDWLYPYASSCSVFGGMLLLVSNSSIIRFYRISCCKPLEASVTTTSLEPGSPVHLHFAFKISRPTNLRSISVFLCWDKSESGTTWENHRDYGGRSVHAEMGKQEGGGVYPAGASLLFESEWSLPDYQMGEKKGELEGVEYIKTVRWIVRIKLELDNGDTLWQEFLLCSGDAWRNLPPLRDSDLNEPICYLALQGEQQYAADSRAIFAKAFCKALPYLRKSEAYHSLYVPSRAATSIHKRLKALGVGTSLSEIGRFSKGRWILSMESLDACSDEEMLSETLPFQGITSPMDRHYGDAGEISGGCFIPLFAPSILYGALLFGLHGFSYGGQFAGLIVCYVGLWTYINRRHFQWAQRR